MLTIRVIYENGKEELREVESVYKLDGSEYVSAPHVQCITQSIPYTYTSGNIYVMNSNGKTIASYNLSGDTH